MLETKKLEYRVYSNFNRTINFPIYAIEFFNFSWAVAGLMINDFEASPLTKNGAIRDCTRDYGIVTPIVAYIMILMGLIQISRLVLYLGALIFHRQIFGYLEHMYRKRLAGDLKTQFPVT